MKPPNPPKKPVNPQAPTNLINVRNLKFLGDYEDQTIQYLLDREFKGIDPHKIKIVFACEEDDEYSRLALLHESIEIDPKYDEKMIKYHIQLEKYEEARRQYKLDVEEYKQKLKLWHEEQLKDLTNS